MKRRAVDCGCAAFSLDKEGVAFRHGDGCQAIAMPRSTARDRLSSGMTGFVNRFQPHSECTPSRSGAAPLAVRGWTGHSALSSATTTSRPHIATAGAYRTRVSEMRPPARRPAHSLGERVVRGWAIAVLEPRISVRRRVREVPRDSA
jgi:hypothetical protein